MGVSASGRFGRADPDLLGIDEFQDSVRSKFAAKARGLCATARQARIGLHNAVDVGASVVS